MNLRSVLIVTGATGLIASASTGLAACGGGSGGAPKVEPVSDPKRTTRVPVEDDEPQDGVEMVGARGRMDPAVIEAGIAPHTTSLSECYTTQVGKRRWLGGHVSLHWEVTKTGEISAVKLAESDLGAWPVEKCLLDVARSATFGKPIGGDADFSLPLDFSAKGRSLSWDEDMAVRAVGGQLAGLDACAEGGDGNGNGNGNGKSGKHGKGGKGGKGGKAAKAASKPAPKLTPPEDVTVTIYVGPQGKAQSVGFSSPKTVLDDAWAECAEKTVLAWRLPDPRGTIAKLAIRYRAN
ncbi:MAG: AgmX/PglI C-terminal domain-containing protein [Deltaproteobacteria bacterium]|nr:AgmX/PglI C-terminal domain-containing protein [Deltaproteobacteria bacterium]